MKLSTFSYGPGKRWSVESFPTLDSVHTLVIVFGAASFVDQPELFDELASAFPQSTMIGCSTAGEITGSLVHDDTIAVAVLQFERSRIKVVSADISEPGTSYAAGELLANQLNSEDLCSVFILADGLQVNGSELAKGFGATLTSHVTVTGGLASDGDRFQRAWVIRNGKPCTGVVTAAGFYGDSLQITHGSHTGWDNFGPERRITRSAGNVVFELDGRSVLSLYKEYLGVLADRIPANSLLLPLSVREDTVDSRESVRTAIAVDEEAQSMTFTGDMPKGYLVQLMRTSCDRLLDSASMAAEQARDNMAIAGPMLVIAITGSGRRMMLGERVEQEIELTQRHLPSDVHQVGFYSYGEISPGISGICELQNQSMTLTTFSEA